MLDRFKNAIDRIGIKVRVFDGNTSRSGNAVIYPSRNSTKIYDGRDVLCEGISEPERYAMFCSSELLENAKYGSIVTVGKNNYILLWSDEFSCKAGVYKKAYLKKMTEEE